ncbi:MAG: alpha-galactosidase [Acidobacteriia bacterium]|nr:alpha-galactosidase [Terriglobia bacterium]
MIPRMKSAVSVLVLLLLLAVAVATGLKGGSLPPRQGQAAAAMSPAAPRFNSALAVGVRPGTPFLHCLAVSGARPLNLAVRRLPPGLKFDAGSGILSGSIRKPGEYIIQAHAENTAGKAEAEIRISCGDRLALTPPMGWNSYDAFGDSVVESEVLANAVWLKEHLQPFGWDTVVVDFRWYDSKADGIRVQNPEGVTIDEYGRCIPPANRFPSAANGAGFKPLADRIHSMGLKFGIHIMRGIPRMAVSRNLPIHDSKFTASEAVRGLQDPARECRWNRDMYGVDATTAAGKAWYADIARQYAAWGVDYIKCDDIANLERGAERYPQAEVEALAEGLRASGRSIVLSLSPGPALLERGEHLKQFAQLWRISGDFWDNWRALDRNFELLSSWLPYAGPGHWPDADMIPLGHICQRNCDVRPDRWTRFSRDEQLTLMSLWALAPSPLMLGMNLPDNDDWTTALLTNPEVLAVNQDPLGSAARHDADSPRNADAWMKPLADRSFAVGFFNRTDQPAKLEVPWRRFGFPSDPLVRDLWNRKDLGRQKQFVAELPPHGCALLRVK